MKIIHNLHMDLARCGCKPIVAAVQGEANTRTLVVSLYDNGVAWEVPENAVVEVAYQKPDGTRGIYSKLPDDTAATTFENNVLTAILAPQALTSPGQVRAAFVFYKGEEEIVATFPFVITVEASPAAGAVLSEDYYNPTVGTLSALVHDLTDLINETMDALPGKIQDSTNSALAEAKESGEFDGPAGPRGEPGVYILAEGETLEDAPEDADVVIDPEGEVDMTLVKSVNGTAPDENGNVTVEIPESSGVDVVAQPGQTILVKEVDENGKPTKWESADYQPRTHWSEVVALLEETTVVPDGEGVFDGENQIGLVARKTYTVNWNGVEYACVAAEVDGAVAIGNAALMMGTGDTGEPFIIVDLPSEIIEEAGYGYMGNVLDGSTSVTLSIKGVEAVPIPQQYLGNAFPYYIEVTGSGTDDDPYAVAETVAEVTAIFNSGRDMVVRAQVADTGAYILYRLYMYGLHDNAYGMAYFFTTNEGTKSGNLYFLFVPQEDGTFAITLRTSISS